MIKFLYYLVFDLSLLFIKTKWIKTIMFIGFYQLYYGYKMISSIFSEIIPKPQNWCPEKFEMDTRKTKWKGYFSVLCTEKNIIICLYFRLTSIKKHQQKMHHVTWYPGFSKQIIWQQDLSGRIQATMQQNTISIGRHRQIFASQIHFIHSSHPMSFIKSETVFEDKGTFNNYVD